MRSNENPDSMEEDIKSFDLQEYINIIKPQDVYEGQVIVTELSGSNFAPGVEDEFPLLFDAFSSLLVCRGEAVVSMDYMPYTLTKHMVLERGNVQILNGFKLSHDFLGYQLILGRGFISHLFEGTIVIPKEYALSKRFEPVLKLDATEFQLLLNIIEKLRQNIRRTDHFFQKALIINEVRNYTMELADMGMQRIKSSGEKLEINHLEDLTLRFFALLVENCKKWHEVSEYSTELCVTPVYLSRTVKSVTGKTAMDWINNARIAEAKILLRRTDLNVQELADKLNFSDQSAFGKFFKKHTGKSPVEYKRQL